jgi:S1-C subfamily serine protease
LCAKWSPGDRLGLRQGDVVLTLDNAVNDAIDEGSLVAVMEQAAIALDVQRDGRALRLLLPLDREERDAAGGR